MPHSLIVGTTESGKSTLARALCAAGEDHGRESLVLDPMYGAWDGAAFQTSDNAEFLRVVWASKNCNVYVDEAGDAIGRYDKVMEQLATRGRHWGHNCHFITQRPAQLSMTVRTQCSILFCFRIDPDDAKSLSKTFVASEVLEAPNLQRGEYLYIRRFRPVEKRRIF